MFAKLILFITDTSGVTGIEYGFILGTVGLAVSTGAFMLGEDISGVFEAVSGYMNEGNSAQ